MKIIIAPDSYKGNMSSPEVCSAIEEGLLRAEKDAEIVKIPLADGGEGTAKAVTEAARGRFVSVEVTGPLGKKHTAEFGLINDGATAVLDMASASGIDLLDRKDLNPLKATSRGTGELIKAALDTGAKELIIGIGGSATNDGGIGMLSALGFRILDENNQDVGDGGQALAKIASFDPSGADPRLKDVSITVACDVTNPLLGERGASAIFGPQKGADPEMVKLLDAGLAKLAQAWIKAGLAKDLEQPGDGAAGGVGAAMRLCMSAKMESGALLVMRHAGFFKHLSNAELVITGEGRTDGQTTSLGKLCSVVANEARKAGVSIALLSGALSGVSGSNSEADALEQRLPSGDFFKVFDYAMSISCGETSFEALLKNGPCNLSFAAENLVRAIQIGRKQKV